VPDCDVSTRQCSTQCQIVTWCTIYCTKAKNSVFSPSMVRTALASTDPQAPGVTWRFTPSFLRFYTSITFVVIAVVHRTKNSSNVHLLDVPRAHQHLLEVPRAHQRQWAANMRLNNQLTTTFDISILCRKVSWLIPRILVGIYYPTRELDEASFMYLIPILFLIFPMHSVSQVPCYFTELLLLRKKVYHLILCL
jgi:hypothetical protein